MEEKKKLYLIITSYPNKGSDSIFVAPEIPELMKWFDITVFCTSGKRDCTHVRDGIEYFYFDMELTLVKKIKYIFKYFASGICRKDLKDIIKMQSLDKKSNLLGRIRKSIEFYGCSEEFYRFFKEKVNTRNEDAIYYTFWNDYYSLSMIIHRKKFPKYHLISRFQGYDLYSERYLYGRQPFKKIINENLEKLYFVAKRPMNYYLEHYPELDSKKVEFHRLGVYGIERDIRKKERKASVIVSCSNVITLKRIDLIIEGLSFLETNIRWIHFGNGDSMGQIRKLAEEKLMGRKNIKYQFLGNVSNEEIRDFYKKNEVRCFITTSSIEGGSPVSVMEALAAGIPVIGTAVGDIADMVNGNGILLSGQPKPHEIAEAINKIVSSSEEEWNRMGEKSYQLWKEKYNAETNAVIFVESVKQIIG